MAVIYMNQQWENKTVFTDFTDFKKIITSRLDDRSLRELENPGYRRSAVMMLFMNKNGQPHLLLTKRTDKVRTHKGQISLPGGGYDDEDEDILETAYRETYEEVGIGREKIELLGRFDDYVSIFGFHITCFVGTVDYPVEYNFSVDEIDDHVEAPLSLFTEEKYYKTEQYNHEGKDYTMYFYNYQGHEIWGLTARFLTDFARKVCNV